MNGIPPSEVEHCLSLCDCLNEITVLSDCGDPEGECPDGIETRYVDGIQVTSLWENGILRLQGKDRDGSELSTVSEPRAIGGFAVRQCQCASPEASVTVRETDENHDGKADRRRTYCSIGDALMGIEVDEAAGEREGQWRVRQAWRASNTIICP